MLMLVQLWLCPSQDLMADLKSELSGDLARLILGLMMPPDHYDAKQLKKAMEVQCGHQTGGVWSAGGPQGLGGLAVTPWQSPSYTQFKLA